MAPSLPYYHGNPSRSWWGVTWTHSWGFVPRKLNMKITPPRCETGLWPRILSGVGWLDAGIVFARWATRIPSQESPSLPKADKSNWSNTSAIKGWYLREIWFLLLLLSLTPPPTTLKRVDWTQTYTPLRELIFMQKKWCWECSRVFPSASGSHLGPWNRIWYRSSNAGCYMYNRGISGYDVKEMYSIHSVKCCLFVLIVSW